MTDNPDFRARLVALLQDTSMTYPLIAQQLGCSTSTVEKFVRDNRVPPAEAA